jgi:hypothetical protein
MSPSSARIAGYEMDGDILSRRGRQRGGENKKEGEKSFANAYNQG